MVIACFILVSVVALSALALAYLVIRRLPQSEYREAEILGQNILAAWQQGNDFGRLSVEQQADPATPTLTVAPRPERVIGPFDNEPDETIIAGDQPEPEAAYAVN